MARHKNVNWNLDDAECPGYDEVKTALLMDLRDELQQLNRVLAELNERAFKRRVDNAVRKRLKRKAAK